MEAVASSAGGFRTSDRSTWEIEAGLSLIRPLDLSWKVE